MFPHPISDPQGHMHGQADEEVQAPADGDWRNCHSLLWGIDLFNHGFYWEAHESWEQLWLAFGRQGALADLVKGLIKLAAACVKAREGRSGGVASHSARAIELITSFRETQNTDTGLGLDLAQVLQLAEAINEQASSLVNRSEQPVVLIAPASLRMQS